MEWNNFRIFYFDNVTSANLVRVPYLSWKCNRSFGVPSMDRRWTTSLSFFPGHQLPFVQCLVLVARFKHLPWSWTLLVSAVSKTGLSHEVVPCDWKISAYGSYVRVCLAACPFIYAPISLSPVLCFSNISHLFIFQAVLSFHCAPVQCEWCCRNSECQRRIFQTQTNQRIVDRICSLFQWRYVLGAFSGEFCFTCTTLK